VASRSQAGRKPGSVFGGEIFDFASVEGEAMKRVRSVVVKSLLLSAVAASIAAIAGLALSRQPATAQGAPITVSPTVPVEVSDPRT
jgi:hypothetical protein